MATVPERYLYIVDLDTGEPLVVLPIDNAQSDMEIARYAAVLRETHRIDDTRMRLALRDSRDAPLEAAVLKAKFQLD